MSAPRISAGVGKINDQVTVISMTHLLRNTPLFMALSSGSCRIMPMHDYSFDDLAIDVSFQAVADCELDGAESVVVVDHDRLSESLRVRGDVFLDPLRAGCSVGMVSARSRRDRRK